MYLKTMLKNRYFPKASFIIILLFIIINLLAFNKAGLKTYYGNDFNYSMAFTGLERGIKYYVPRIAERIFLCKDYTQFTIVLILLGLCLISIDVKLVRNSLWLMTIFMLLGIAGTMAYLGTPVKDYELGVVPVMTTAVFLGMVAFIELGIFGLLKVLVLSVFITGFLTLGGWSMDIGKHYIFIWRFLALGVLMGIVLYGRKIIVQKIFENVEKIELKKCG